MLNETVLVNAHKQLGGKLVDFSGWLMPVNYGSQIEEHHSVRRAAGMFDVSHMTIVDVQGADAKAYLQKLLANDVAKLQSPGKALYSAMLNESGGVIDDLIVYLMSSGYRLVVNCGTREKDLAWLTRQTEGFQVVLQEQPQLAMIAIQGPNARETFDSLLSAADQAAVKSLTPFSGAALKDKEGWFVARTGYTGEDGYEVMLPESHAVTTWQSLLNKGVKPCGLGARDTLRLEAGMNLYGHEMHDEVSPLQANMGWTIAWSDTRDFIGKTALMQEKSNGVANKLVGLVMQSRGVLRDGYSVQIPESAELGVVTSGTFSPTLGVSIALARVPQAAQHKAQVIIRGKAVDVDIVRPCFVRNGAPV